MQHSQFPRLLFASLYHFTVSPTMAPRSFSQEDSQLIAELHSLHKMSPKLVKAAEYAPPALPAVTVESWKMNEFKCYGFRLHFRPSHGDSF